MQPKVSALGQLRHGGAGALVDASTRRRCPRRVRRARRAGGLIHDLTRLVLDRAVAACAGWQHLAPGVGVSVNVSARSLGDDAIVRLVDRLLRTHALAAGLLTLEITESHIMANPDATLGVLRAETPVSASWSTTSARATRPCPTFAACPSTR